MITSDNWIITHKQDKSENFTVYEHKCLWHSACLENGVPELTRVFCENDDITFGSLTKVNFSRNGTIGFGNEFCDFNFKK